MRPASLRRSWFYVAVASAIAIVSASAAKAELGAVRSAPVQTAPALRIYQLGVISDGPDPISGVWAQYGAPNASRAVLNPEGATNGDGMPSVAFSPVLGVAAVAWAKNSPNGFDVVISRYDGTDWTVPQVVVGAPGVNELDPQLLVGPDGSLHLFYWVDGSSPRVFYTSAPAGSINWSTPIPVSPPGQVTLRPAGAFFEGVLRVVYEVHEFGYGNSPRQVVIARYESGSFITEVVAMTNYTGEVRPQVHSHGGKLWVDWIDTETTGHSGELAWTRMDSQGQWEPISFQPYDGIEEREFLVRGSARMLAIQP
jgi:hypothetical protein